MNDQAKMCNDSKKSYDYYELFIKSSWSGSKYPSFFASFFTNANNIEPLNVETWNSDFFLISVYDRTNCPAI